MSRKNTIVLLLVIASLVACGILRNSLLECRELGYADVIYNENIPYCVTFGLEPRIMRLDTTITE